MTHWHSSYSVASCGGDDDGGGNVGCDDDGDGDVDDNDDDDDDDDDDDGGDGDDDVDDDDDDDDDDDARDSVRCTSIYIGPDCSPPRRTGTYALNEIDASTTVLFTLQSTCCSLSRPHLSLRTPLHYTCTVAAFLSP